MDVGLDKSSLQLICRRKQVVVGHTACALRAYFANTLFLCSNDSPSLFVDDVLQHWTMVKLVLMQIVADVNVHVGFFLGATADAMLDSE